jgi:hypothetical protein
MNLAEGPTLRVLDQSFTSYEGVARVPGFWEIPLWRQIRTVFFLPYPYLFISFVRRWTYDSIVLLPPLAAGIWWVSFSKGTDLPTDLKATADSGETFLFSYHVARFYPTLIAFLLCVILLRSERTAKVKKSVLRGTSVAARLPLGVVLFLGALALLDLILVSGSIFDRALPIVVAGAWIWLIRTQLYRRTRLLEPTGAGFRPPLRILSSRKKRQMVQRCMLWTRQPKLTPAEIRVNLAQGIAQFARTGDTRTCAWCVARAVDYNLGIGALSAAEQLLENAELRYHDLMSEPDLSAAIGLFYLAIGSRQAAGELRRAQSLCSAARRRVPYRLRTLLAEAVHKQEPGRGVPQWSGRARVALVWNRRYAPVIQDVLARTQEFADRNPQLAVALAMFIGNLVGELGKEEARSDLEPLEAINLAVIKGAAWERAGELLAGAQLFQESAAAYLEAARLYVSLAYRPRAGLASAYAAAMSLRAGRAAGNSGLEARLLSAMLIGLRDLEHERGLLTDNRHRYQLLTSRENLHTHVFHALAECVYFNHRRAAELALWLAESVHRSALAERIRESHQSLDVRRPPAAGKERRPVKPVDMAKLREIVTGRVVLYYRCAKTTDGWLLWTIMACSQDITLHQAALANPSGGQSSLTHPAGLLHQLDSGQSSEIEFIHNNVNLYSPAWAGLAGALLPPGLASALRQAATADRPASLLIVPDGPLSSVPFAGLRLPDGSALADRAAVMFMPNLLWLAGNTVWPATASADAATIVTHLGPTKFASTFRALRRSTAFADLRLTTLRTADRAALETRLGDSQPDVVVISQHGETAADPADRFIHLSDGGKLSEADAERLHWPRTVVLGSCWPVTSQSGQAQTPSDSRPRACSEARPPWWAASRSSAATRSRPGYSAASHWKRREAVIRRWPCARQCSRVLPRIPTIAGASRLSGQISRYGQSARLCEGPSPVPPGSHG